MSIEEGRKAEAAKVAVYMQSNAKAAAVKEKETTSDSNKSDTSDGEGLLRKATATKKKGLSSWFGLGKKKGDKEKEKKEDEEKDRDVEKEREKERERERALLAKKAVEALNEVPAAKSHAPAAARFQAGSLPASDTSGSSCATVHTAASAAVAAAQKHASQDDSPKSLRSTASAISASASSKSQQQQRRQQQQQQDSDRNSSPDTSPKNRRVSLSGDICLGNAASSGKDVWQQMGSLQQQHRRISPPSSNRRASLDQQRTLPPLQMAKPRAPGGFPDAGRDAQSAQGERKHSPWDSGASAGVPGSSPKHSRESISPHEHRSINKPPSPHLRSPVGAERVKDAVTDFIRMSFGDEFQPQGAANGRNPWQISSGGEGESGSDAEGGKHYRQEPQTGGRRSVGRRSLDLFEHARAGAGSPHMGVWDDSPQAMKQHQRQQHQHHHHHQQQQHHHQGRPYRQSNLSPPEMSSLYPGRSAPSSPMGESSDLLNSSGRFSVSSAFAAYSPPESGSHHRRIPSGHSDRPISPHSKPPSPPTTGRASLSGQHVYPHSTQASPRNPFADTSDAESSGYDLNVRSSRRGRGGRASLELQRVKQVDEQDNSTGDDSSGGEGAARERRRYEVKVSQRVVANSARATGSGKNEHAVQVRHAGRQKQMRADDTSKRNCLGNYELDGLSSEQLARLLAKRQALGGNTAAGSAVGSPGQVSKQLQKEISRLSDSSSSLSVEDLPDPAGLGTMPPSFGSQKRTTREKTGTARRAQNVFEGMFSAAKKAPGRLMGKGHRDHVLQQAYEDVAGKFALSKDELGSGQYGVIRRCMEIETGKVYACKTIKKEGIRVSG